MKYKLLLILSIFMFVPVLKAETYYDWEIVNVDSLPTASSDTVYKVYQVSNRYYITNVIKANYVPLPLGENLNGKTIYINDLTPVFDLISEAWYTVYAKSSPEDSTFDNSSRIGTLCGFTDDNITWSGDKKVLAWKSGSTIHQIYNHAFTTDCNIKSWNTSIVDMSKYFSLKPFDTKYEWKEINKLDVIEIGKNDSDFYLFYSFEDISKFNILSNYNLSNFNDFQKIIITLGFNGFFLGLFGLCVYIGLKFINKGLSILFK